MNDSNSERRQRGEEGTVLLVAKYLKITGSDITAIGLMKIYFEHPNINKEYL